MMERLPSLILELVRLAATDLPKDVEDGLQTALEKEENGSSGKIILESILENVALARTRNTPICQDTGTPLFYIHYPTGMSVRQLRKAVNEAVAEATRLHYLRPNSVHPISGVNTGNNLGDDYFPYISFEEVDSDAATIDLILKGGGSENVGAQYRLPDEQLHAGRDLDGVRRVILDAAFKAQGQGCPPGVLGVGIGGDRSSSYAASKKVLLRRLDDVNPDSILAALETQITNEVNQLGIGPMGLGGKTSLMGVKLATLHRLPACYFVSISYMCWAYRRRKMMVDGVDVSFV